MPNNRPYRIIGAFLSLLVLVLVIMAVFSHKPASSQSDHRINIVAAENFWGSLVSQIGGNKVQVHSLVSDPNADPHEYESNANDAKDIASSQFVIVNGVGYDTWMNKLVSASPNASRLVLNVGDLVNKKEGDNPHLWYNPSFVNKTIKQMEVDLIKLDPSDKTYFVSQYDSLVKSLSVYQDRIAQIKKQYAGTKVAATEDIFAYLAQAAGLNLISPTAFTEAVAEGNDPPSSSIVEFQSQLSSNQPTVLVYNMQTVTPLTDSIKALAAQQNIPVVGVTETIQPPNTSFQVWMNSEVLNLENALNSRALGQ